MPSTPSARPAEPLRLPAGRVLIACSGGADSLGLAALAAAGSEARRLVLCYVDHGLRSLAERLADIAAVRRAAECLSLPLYICTAPLRSQNGAGPEDSARRVRYAALEWLRHRLGCSWIATAHHQQDQLETLLMRLADGAPPDAFGGIPSLQGHVIRPVLDRSPAELADAAAERGLRSSYDSTNRDQGLRRNRVRAGIGQQLEDELVKHSMSFASGRESARKSAESAAAWIRRSVPWKQWPLPLSSGQLLPGLVPQWRELALKSLLKLPRGLRIRALLMALQDCVGGFRVPWGHLERLLDELGPETREIGPLVVRISSGWLQLFPRDLPAEPADAWQTSLEDLPQWGWYCLPLRAHARSPLRLRPALPGDRIPCAGGTRLLGDVCRDLGIPPALRRLVPVLEAAGRPVLAYTAALGRQYPLPQAQRARAAESSEREDASWFCLRILAW